MMKENQGRTKEYFIGLDVGGTKCAVVLGDQDFNILQKIKFDTLTDRGYEAILDEFMLHLDTILNNIDRNKIKQIGISCGGPLDSAKGIIYSPPNLPGWDNVPIVDIFEKYYGIPTAIQNDANASALAEWLMGAGKGTRNMVFLTFGTGMGAGLILNGALYSGTNDLGGEVGHLRMAKSGPIGFGKAGSFEGFCSGGGIAQMARETVENKRAAGEDPAFARGIDINRLDAKTVAVAARDGDETATEILATSAEYLGKGLSVLVDVLNPECIVIGSIYARNEEFFKPRVEKVLREEAIPGAVEVCQIRPAQLGDAIGDYAALCVAVNEYNSKNKAL